MRVYGEAYWLINGWMNFLSLLLAARIGRTGFSPGRGALAAGLGAAYAVAAWGSFPLLRGAPAALLACLGMTALAFGRDGGPLFLCVLAGQMALSGLATALLGQGLAPWEVTLLAGAAALLLSLFLQQSPPKREKAQLVLFLNGRQVRLPALRDSGNLLRWGAAGVPVIVAPQNALQSLLPPNVRPQDLSTLPPGWRLLRVQTAAASRTLMGFMPDRAVLRWGGRAWQAEAAVALSDFSETRALVPESLWEGGRPLSRKGWRQIKEGAWNAGD